MGARRHQASAYRRVSSAVGSEGLSQATAQALMPGRTSQPDSWPPLPPPPVSETRHWGSSGGVSVQSGQVKAIHPASIGHSAELGNVPEGAGAGLLCLHPSMEGASPLFTRSLRQAILSSQNKATKASSVGCEMPRQENGRDFEAC